MKLLFVVNVDWFFLSHRLPIALAAIEKGWEVHLACQTTDKREVLESYGIIVHQVDMSRSGFNPFGELKPFQQILNVIRRIKPDTVHLVAMKGVILGGLASVITRIKKVVVSISGLGFVFIDSSVKAKLLRLVIMSLFRFILNGKNVRVIFQNETDRALFISNNVVKKNQTVLVNGSGVDLELFKFIPEENTSRPIVMFLGRLLKDKGVQEFFDAAKMLKQKGSQARFVLVGDIDSGNLNSLTQTDIDEFVASGYVEAWGYKKNMHEVLPAANIIVLPSYREGHPKSLAEAAACGRAVVTTDVPGCRDAIIENNTGLLVPLKSSKELAEAMETLINNESLRKRYGRAGRDLAESKFDVNGIVEEHLSIYRCTN